MILLFGRPVGRRSTATYRAAALLCLLLDGVGCGMILMGSMRIDGDSSEDSFAYLYKRSATLDYVLRGVIHVRLIVPFQ